MVENRALQRPNPRPQNRNNQPNRRQNNGGGNRNRGGGATMSLSICVLPATAAATGCCAVGASSQSQMPSAPLNMPPVVLSSARLRVSFTFETRRQQP